MTEECSKLSIIASSNSINGLRLAQTSPAYLDSNSTSHTWVFSAIAEIIDNAYDPDCRADSMEMAHEYINGLDYLTFTDDGRGMPIDKLHKMLSFGYCSKQAERGYKPVGQYGNGFKSSSMRIGKDALVLTKCWSADGSRLLKSVGFLSQTFLANVGADTVILPICSWVDDAMIDTDPDGYQSLALICDHCPLFSGSQQLLMDQFDIIPVTGTRIIIYNLKRCSEQPDAALELDFRSVPGDIICLESVSAEALNPAQRMLMNSLPQVPEYRRSLRSYLSILYMRPRMAIRIDGQAVQSQHMQRVLTRQCLQYYSPKLSQAEFERMDLRLNYRCRMVIGFLPQGHADYGALLYHRNRLILAYEKLVKEPNKARGVALVAEVDHLQPNHVKQDFERNQNFRNCMARLTHQLREYLDLNGRAEPGSTGQAAVYCWLECSRCGKCRRLPASGASRELDKRTWHCAMSTDAFFNSCNDPEEDDDSEVSRLLLEAREASIASVMPNGMPVAIAANLTNEPRVAVPVNRYKRRRTVPVAAVDVDYDAKSAPPPPLPLPPAATPSTSSTSTSSTPPPPSSSWHSSSDASHRRCSSAVGESPEVVATPQLGQVKSEPRQPREADATADATAGQELVKLRASVLQLLQRLLPGDASLPIAPDRRVDVAVAAVLQNWHLVERSDNESEVEIKDEI